MSRLTIDISPEQHKSLKALAALEGKTIRQYTLERLFPRGNTAQPNEPQRSTAQPGASSVQRTEAQQGAAPGRRSITLGELLDKDEAAMDGAEKAAWASFTAFIEERAAEALAGAVSAKSVDQIFREALEGEGHAFE